MKITKIGCGRYDVEVEVEGGVEITSYFVTNLKDLYEQLLVK